MATKAILQPAIPYRGKTGYLLWVRNDMPAVYRALVARFPAVAKFENTYIGQHGLGQLEDIADSVDSSGSSIGDIFSSIGDFVSKNAAPILGLATTAVVAVKQTQLANTQLQIAQLNRTPVRTAIAYTPQGVPYSVPVASAGTLAAQPSTSILGAPWISGIPNWVTLTGGAGVLALLFALRR